MIVRFGSEMFDAVGDAQVVIMSGLPGTGKTYLARKLAKWIGAIYISSDILRRNNFELTNDKYQLDSDQYMEFRDRVYELMQRRMMQRARAGKKVIVDATFLDEHRAQFLEVLSNAGLLDKTVVLLVKAGGDLIHHRMIQRKRSEIEPTEFESGFQRISDWFNEQIQDGSFSFPSEHEGVKVIEVWNE